VSRGLLDNEIVEIVIVEYDPVRRNYQAYGKERERIPLYPEHLRLFKVAGYDTAWQRPEPVSVRIPVLVSDTGGHRRVAEVQTADGQQWIARRDRQQPITEPVYQGHPGDPIVYTITETTYEPISS
jgi:hypothetical protein